MNKGREHWYSTSQKPLNDQDRVLKNISLIGLFRKNNMASW